MKPARLTGGLLARKGGAAPLAGAYGGTSLEPLIGLFGRGAPRPASAWAETAEPVRAIPSEPPRSALAARPAIEPIAIRRNAPVRLGLRLDPDRHARLRIMAARKGVRPQDLLRDALDEVLAAAKDDCPCVRGELPCCGKPDC